MTAAEPNHIWIPCDQCTTGSVEVRIGDMWGLVICGRCNGKRGWWHEPSSMSVGLAALERYYDTREERINAQIEKFRAAKRDAEREEE